MEQYKYQPIETERSKEKKSDRGKRKKIAREKPKRGDGWMVQEDLEEQL